MIRIHYHPRSQRALCSLSPSNAKFVAVEFDFDKIYDQIFIFGLPAMRPSLLLVLLALQSSDSDALTFDGSTVLHIVDRE